MLNIIIPLHTLENGIMASFENLIKKLKTQKDQNFTVTVVTSNSENVQSYVTNEVDYGDLSVNILKNNGDTTFQGQINYAISKITSDYVAIIEADDEVNEYYVSNANQHISAYPDIDVFLPIVVETNSKGEFLTLTNESVWAMNLTEKIGYLDNETLKEYENYQISGMVIKRKVYSEVGGLKSKIVLTFGYEFLLRLTEKGKVIYVMPKTTYKHTNMREGSLFWEYQNGNDRITPEIAKFWMDTARKEYFHTKDREITLDIT